MQIFNKVYPFHRIMCSVQPLREISISSSDVEKEKEEEKKVQKKPSKSVSGTREQKGSRKKIFISMEIVKIAKERVSHLNDLMS